MNFSLHGTASLFSLCNEGAHNNIQHNLVKIQNDGSSTVQHMNSKVQYCGPVTHGRTSVSERLLSKWGTRSVPGEKIGVGYLQIVPRPSPIYAMGCPISFSSRAEPATSFCCRSLQTFLLRTSQLKWQSVDRPRLLLVCRR